MDDDRKKFRRICKKRLKTANILIENGDYEGAIYMLGFALECALKAATCKTLNIEKYPQNTREKKVDAFFMTHRFDRLKLVAGLSTIFGANSGNQDSFRNWSEFTQEYLGEWTSMRYEETLWSEEKARGLYNNLIEKDNGIISIIKKGRLW